MPFDDPDMQMHRALLQQARQRKLDERRIKRQQLAGSKMKRMRKYTTGELRSEIKKRSARKRTPEMIAAAVAKRELTRAIRRKYCDHKKLAPKLRKGGKNAGRYVCPSCNAPVAAPRAEEGLVV